MTLFPTEIHARQAGTVKEPRLIWYPSGARQVATVAAYQTLWALFDMEWRAAQFALSKFTNFHQNIFTNLHKNNHPLHHWRFSGSFSPEGIQQLFPFINTFLISQRTIWHPLRVYLFLSHHAMWWLCTDMKIFTHAPSYMGNFCYSFLVLFTYQPLYHL